VIKRELVNEGRLSPWFDTAKNSQLSENKLKNIFTNKMKSMHFSEGENGKYPLK